MVTPRWLAWPLSQRDVMIDPVLLEHGRPKIAPQDGGHAEFPCLFKGFRNFDD